MEDAMALGTAQLGMQYGVANVAGKPTPEVARDIVGAAWDAGIRFFDTAQAYENSETVLGAALSQHEAGTAKLVTKLAPELGDTSASLIRASLVASCARLGVPRLWAILLHSESQLDQWSGYLGATLRDLRSAGLTSHLGVSIYSTSRALQALDLPDLTVVQVPANIFDRRMERAGVFRRAQELGKHVFVRSVYLQGLAAMEPEKLPHRLAFARPALNAYEEHCCATGGARDAFAVSYMRRKAPAATLVVGAETTAQVRRNIELAAAPPLDVDVVEAWDRRWPSDIAELIDPSRWPRAEA